MIFLSKFCLKKKGTKQIVKRSLVEAGWIGFVMVPDGWLVYIRTNSPHSLTLSLYLSEKSSTSCTKYFNSIQNPTYFPICILFYSAFSLLLSLKNGFFLLQTTACNTFRQILQQPNSFKTFIIIFFCIFVCKFRFFFFNVIFKS